MDVPSVDVPSEPATQKIKKMSSYVIGVDVGGTNTDAVILCDRTVVAAAKRPTTQDKTSGIVNAISAALERLSEQERTRVLASVSRVSIGTTHFTNAVAERDAARLARVAVIRLCGSSSRALPPYVDFPEDLLQIIYGGTHMVSGGLQYNGRLISAIDEEELKGTVREILKQDPPVRNVAILGIFSPRDDPVEGQEARAAKIVQSECAEISCTLSHAVRIQQVYLFFPFFFYSTNAVIIANNRSMIQDLQGQRKCV